MNETAERDEPLTGTADGLAELAARVGSTLGNGQCYAVPAYYALNVTGRPHLCAGVPGACPISDTTGADTVAASNIGYAYLWNDCGWAMKADPAAHDLQVGGIITWKPYQDVAITEYGHVGVIEGLDGSTIHTIEQNAEAGQVVARYTRTWKPGIFQHIIYIEGESMPSQEEIAKGVWERTITNHWKNDVPAWTLLRDTHEMVEKQPNRVWDEGILNRWDETHGARHIFAAMDRNVVTALEASVEANERTKAISDIVSKLADVDPEATEKTVREAVNKVMDGYELTPPADTPNEQCDTQADTP